MKNIPVSAKVNDKHQFDLTSIDLDQLDLIRDANGDFHLLLDGNSYQATLLQTDLNTKSFTFRIEGQDFTVQLTDSYDQLVQAMGLSLTHTQKIHEIHAPMPGLVLQVSVEAGQSVTKGEPLLILEAMKMENILKAPADVTIQSVEVQPGQAVEKGQLLFNLD